MDGNYIPQKNNRLNHISVAWFQWISVSDRSPCFRVYRIFNDIFWSICLNTLINNRRYSSIKKHIYITSLVGTYSTLYLLVYPKCYDFQNIYAEWGFSFHDVHLHCWLGRWYKLITEKWLNGHADQNWKPSSCTIFPKKHLGKYVQFPKKATFAKVSAHNVNGIHMLCFLCNMSLS